MVMNSCLEGLEEIMRFKRVWKWRGQRVQDQKGGGTRLRDHRPVCDGEVMGQKRSFILRHSHDVEVLVSTVSS